MAVVIPLYVVAGLLGSNYLINSAKRANSIKNIPLSAPETKSGSLTAVEIFLQQGPNCTFQSLSEHLSPHMHIKRRINSDFVPLVFPMDTVDENSSVKASSASYIGPKTIQTSTEPPKRPMVHNNMVPFFTGANYHNTTIDNVAWANKLETHTGNFKLRQQVKHEIAPHFTPIKQEEAYLPFYAPRQTYRFVNNLQSRNNELPFCQQRVAPGLADGYTTRGSGGFHNSLRILPKVSEQLVLNPRTSKEGRIIRGGAINKRTSMPQMFQRKKPVLVTNLKGERNFTDVGSVIKPKVYSDIVLRNTKRKFSEKVLGIAGQTEGQRALADKDMPKVRISQKISYKGDYLHNAHQAEGERANKGLLGWRQYWTNRGDTGACIDAYKTSLKGREAPAVQFIDQAKTTHRQTTEANSHQGHLKGHEAPTVQFADQAKTTHRQTTEANSHQGHLKGHEAPTVQFADQAKTTHRQTTEANSHQGHLKGHEAPTVPFVDQAKTTHRQTTEANSHQGHLKGQERHKVYDPFDVAKTTHRQTTQDNKYIAGVQSSEAQNKGGYMTYDSVIRRWVSRPETSRANTGNAYRELGEIDRTSACNMRQNVLKEHISKGRQPTLVGATRPPGKEFINLQVNKLDSDRVNPYLPPSKGPEHSISVGHIGELTSIRQPESASCMNRTDPQLLSPLKSNPLAQSIHSSYKTGGMIS